MHYVKKDVMKKLKELKLVEIPESYKLNESSFPGAIYSGFDETDLIIYMQKNAEIESNYNFRPITKGDLKINGKKKFFKKENFICLK